MREFTPPRFLRSRLVIGVILAGVVAGAVYWLQLPGKDADSCDRRIEKLLKETRRQSSRSSPPYWVRRAMWMLPRWLRPRDEINTYNELHALGTNTIPRLSEVLRKDSEPDVRAVAASVLGDLEEPRLLSLFTNALLVETNDQAWICICGAIAQIGGSNCVPLLVARLASETNLIRRVNVIEVLGRLPGPLALKTSIDVMLQDRDETERLAAIEGVAKSMDPIAISNLNILLQSNPSARLRQAVVGSLGRLDTAAANDLLVTRMRTDTDSHVRSGAAEALARNVTPETALHLRDCLATERDPAVRLSIMRALETANSPEALLTLRAAATNDPDQTVRDMAIDGLRAYTSRQSVEELKEAVRSSPFPVVREAAATELVEAGDDATLPLLLQYLAESHARSLATALSTRGNQQIEPLMKEWLLSPSNTDELRSEALTALGTLANPASLGLFVTHLTNTSPSMRSAAADALGNYPCEMAVDALIRVLGQETNMEVLSSCVSSLGTIRSPRAVPALTRFIETQRNEFLRGPAYQALGKIPGSTPVSMLARAARRERSEIARTAAIRALGENGSPEANQALMTCLGRCDHWNISERVLIIEALGISTVASNAPVLIPLLDEPDQRITAAAAKALGSIGRTNALPGLIRLATAGAPAARAQAATALGEIGDSSALPVLFEVLRHDRGPNARTKAAEALGIISDPHAIPELRLHLSDPEEQVRTEVLCSLGHLGDTNCLPSVIELLASDRSDVRFSASYFLIEIGGSARAGALMGNLQHREPDTRFSAACALAALGRTNAIPVLHAYMNHSQPWYRLAAVVSLAQLKCPESEELLKLKTADRAPAIARLASAGLSGNLTGALVAAMEDKDPEIRRTVAFACLFVKEPSVIPALQRVCCDRDSETRRAARWTARRMERINRAGSPVALSTN